MAGAGPHCVRDLCEMRFGAEGLAFCKALGPWASLPAIEAARIPEEELKRAAGAATVMWVGGGRLDPRRQEAIIDYCFEVDRANCVLPSLPDPLPRDWVRQPVPRRPASWERGGFELPKHRRRLLQRMNKNRRDERIWFDEGPHQYWVDGIAVGWSVTGLVSKFCREFVAAEVINGMRQGKNWPRAGYVTLSPEKRAEIAEDLARVLRSVGRGLEAEACMKAGASPPPEVAAHGEPPHADDLAMMVQQLRRSCEHASSPLACGIKRAVSALADGEEEIVAKWECNKEEAANRGTWMHLQCELWLNRDGADLSSPEMVLFLRYVRERLVPNHVVAYRTEWEVFAESMDLAGSIDFVGLVTEGRDVGALWVVDWKRAKQLRSKDLHPFGQCMHEPLDQVPDASKCHYALQLNLYAYILENCYGFRVARREVACFHPDNGEEPYWFEVPALPAITFYLVAAQQKLASDAVEQRALAALRGSEEEIIRLPLL